MDYRIGVVRQDFTEEVTADMQKALSDALTEAAESAASYARMKVVEQSVDTGALEASIGTDVSAPLMKVVFSGNNRVPYDIFIEEGTRPHWPPQKPIREWVRRNLAVRTKGRTKEYRIKAPKDEGFRRVRAKTAEEQQEVNRVAFLIARKIAKEGTEPKPFMRPAMVWAQEQLPFIVAKHTKEAGA